MTTWNGTRAFNEYATFVQALRLDVWSVGSCSLIRFWGPPSSCAVHFVINHQRWNTKVLKKKLKPSDWLDQWLKWETENTHLGGKKRSPFAALFLPVLSFCTEEKPLLYLFVEERWCISLFWSLYLFEMGILWDVIHKCFTAQHFLHSHRVCDYGCEEKLLRMGALLRPWQGRTQPPCSWWNLRLNSSLCTWSQFVYFVLQSNSFFPFHF